MLLYFKNILPRQNTSLADFLSSTPVFSLPPPKSHFWPPVLYRAWVSAASGGWSGASVSVLPRGGSIVSDQSGGRGPTTWRDFQWLPAGGLDGCKLWECTLGGMSAWLQPHSLMRRNLEMALAYTGSGDLLGNFSYKIFSGVLD